MTARADYVVKVLGVEGRRKFTFKNLTDVEYRLLRSLQFKIAMEFGYPIIEFHQVGGSNEKVEGEET